MDQVLLNSAESASLDNLLTLPDQTIVVVKRRGAVDWKWGDTAVISCKFVGKAWPSLQVPDHSL